MAGDHSSEGEEIVMKKLTKDSTPYPIFRLVLLLRQCHGYLPDTLLLSTRKSAVFSCCPAHHHYVGRWQLLRTNGSFTALFGLVLDIQSLSQRRRAQIGFALVVIPSTVCLSWLCWCQKTLLDEPLKMDWSHPKFLVYYMPFLGVQVVGYLCQTYVREPASFS